MTAQNSSTPSLNNTASNTHNYSHQNPPQLAQPPPSISDHTSGPSSHPLLPPHFRTVHHRGNPDLHQSISSAAPSSASSFSLFPSAESASRHHSVSSSSASNLPAHQQHLSSQLLPPSSSTTPPSNIFAGSAVKPAGGGGVSGSAGSPHLSSLAVAQLNLLISTTNERNYEVRIKEIRKVSFSLLPTPPPTFSALWCPLLSLSCRSPCTY